MKMNRHIFAVLVMSALGVSVAKADTTRLTAEDGWTKITSLPTAADLANNYYVFVDNTNDLMLGVAKGVNQNTKWYSLGVFYQNSVEPTSADINGKTWIVESSGSGYSLRNLEHSAQPMMTEWNAAWKFDTNDVYQPDGNWTVTLWNYANGSWTIQNGKYPDSGYLGPWNDSNFANGAECAANKSGANVGHFQIYAISRTQFRQNLLDNASESNPVDLTPWYVNNATFDANNRTGWTEEGSGGNNNTAIGCEIWHRSNFKIYQNLSVPNGKYKTSLQMAGTTGAGQVYATSSTATQSAASSAAAGSNFQNTVLSMIQDRTFGKVTTAEVEVTDGSLQIGMKCETTDQWIVFDNFKLYCTGVDLSAYVSQLSDLVSECNAFISSAVVPDACETIISDAITTYNKSYSTAKEYSAAIVALTAVLASYRNDTELQSAYAAYKAFRTQATGLTEGQPSSDALTTFNGAVSTANNTVEAATTVGAITTQKASLRSALLTYISSVDGQFDITFLASQKVSDWKKKDGTAAGEVTWAVTNRGDWTFAESYESTCATTGTVLYQTVSDLPVGYYQVGMYAMAAYTSGRGFDSEATEGDANRSFAFAGNLADESTLLRTGIAIPFKTSFDFSELTTLDVNVHLSAAGDLSFGVQKDANGSNWHFAQIATIVYSRTPDLTLLQATRDALVAEAEGLLNNSANYLTAAQQSALRSAITAGNNAADFDALNTVTLTTLPNAINTAKQQIQQVKDNRVQMIAALERFENDYNLADGTDYRRSTMSADAWATLIDKVNAVTIALDDISLSTEYGARKDALVAQMDQTDASLRLFKSYKAMVEGVASVVGGSVADAYGTSANMDDDEAEETAISALNAAFGDYVASQSEDFSANVFLGGNLDFSADEGATLNGDNSNNIHAVSGWDVAYANADTWTVVQTHQTDNDEKLYLRKNWGEQATTLAVTKQRMLPAGRYSLSLKWNSTLENMTNQSCFTLGDLSTTIGKATGGEETLSYVFTVAEPTPFDLAIGFQKTGTGNTPAQLVVDDVTLTCLPTLVFADGSVPSYNAGTHSKVKILRTLTADRWVTAVYPFAVPSGSNLEVATLSSYDISTGTLRFTTSDASTANEPFLMRSAINVDEINLEDVAVEAAEVTNVVASEASLIGIYEETVVTNAEKNYVLSNNVIHPVGSVGATIPVYRAYIQLQESGDARALAFTVDGDETTGIEQLADVRRHTAAPVYDLQGRICHSVSGTQNYKKGFYIQNGKKVVVK